MRAFHTAYYAVRSYGRLIFASHAIFDVAAAVRLRDPETVRDQLLNKRDVGGGNDPHHAAPADKMLEGLQDLLKGAGVVVCIKTSDY